MRVENVVLPKSGYFGISAATGGLADDHDVVKFSVYSLRSPEMAVTQEPDHEAQKFEEEFQQYQQKLNQQKDQWAKDNPEEAAKKTEMDDWDNWFSEQDKELQQIYQGQSAMKEVLTDLHRKMDEIIGRQERTLSLISQVLHISKIIFYDFGFHYFVHCFREEHRRPQVVATSLQFSRSVWILFVEMRSMQF